MMDWDAIQDMHQYMVSTGMTKGEALRAIANVMVAAEQGEPLVRPTTGEPFVPEWAKP